MFEQGYTQVDQELDVHGQEGVPVEGDGFDGRVVRTDGGDVVITDEPARIESDARLPLGAGRGPAGSRAYGVGAE